MASPRSSEPTGPGVAVTDAPSRASGHTSSTTVVTVCAVLGSVSRGSVGPADCRAAPNGPAAVTRWVLPTRTVPVFATS